MATSRFRRLWAPGPSAWSTEQVVTGPREVWLEMSLLGEGANPDDEGDAPFRSFVLDWRHVGALIGLAGQLDDRRGRRAELASRRYPAKAGDDAAVAVDQNGGLVQTELADRGGDHGNVRIVMRAGVAGYGMSTATGGRSLLDLVQFTTTLWLPAVPRTKELTACQI